MSPLYRVEPPGRLVPIARRDRSQLWAALVVFALAGLAVVAALVMSVLR